MTTVIESSGGISGVRVTVSGPQPAAKSTPVKWEGAGFINNIAYTKEGLHVWRAYGIGSGKFVPWSNFRQQVGSLPQLNKQKRSSSAKVSFQTAKARSKPKQKPGDGSVLPMGWAFKSAGVQRKNLTVAQKNYLTEVFQAGERTGQKADPTSVSKAMR
ncbi:unnamed protein product, partial [Porites lobata]